MKKRLISLILSLVVAMTYMPLSVSAQSQDAKRVENVGIECYYSDSYFSQPATKFNPSLASMSLAMAIASMGDYVDMAHQSKRIANLMENIGMSVSWNEAYEKDPTADSIAVIVGSKKIGNKTLVALAVRSGGYGNEWASNFTMGERRDHQGFNDAKNQTIKFLRNYLRTNKIKGKVNFWITGYSRGAATANLVAAAIDRKELYNSDIRYTKKDVYAYTFETPAGADELSDPNSSKYNNIFNVINITDLVTYVAPAELGFYRYGVDKFLPSPETDPVHYEEAKELMLQRFNKSSKDQYIIDGFKSMNINPRMFANLLSSERFITTNLKDQLSQGYFMSQIVPLLCNELIKGRDGYNSNFQQVLRDIFGSEGFYEGARGDSLAEYFISTISPELDDIMKNLFSNDTGKRKNALTLISDCIKEVYRLSEIRVSEQEVIQIRDELVGKLMDFAAKHPQETATLAANLGGVVQAHMPSLCFAWVTSMDPNYAGSGVNRYNDGTYRVVKVDSGANLKVYNSQDQLVAQIEDTIPIPLLDSSYVYGYNTYDQSYVLLPSNGKYRIEISSESNTSSNILITDYSSTMVRNTKATYYQSVDIDPLTPLSLTVGSTYRLSKNNRTVKATSVLSGSNARGILCDVKVSSQDTAMGTVKGSGLFKEGSTVTVKATSKAGYTFDGWYDGKTKVSSVKTHTFTVDSNTKLIAKFKKA